MDWMSGLNTKTDKMTKKSMDLGKDVRVLYSEPTDESWECRAGHASQEEIEPYPLYNQGRARHTLDTKTNCCVLIFVGEF